MKIEKLDKKLGKFLNNYTLEHDGENKFTVQTSESINRYWIEFMIIKLGLMAITHDSKGTIYKLFFSPLKKLK